MCRTRQALAGLVAAGFADQPTEMPVLGLFRRALKLAEAVSVAKDAKRARLQVQSQDTTQTQAAASQAATTAAAQQQLALIGGSISELAVAESLAKGPVVPKDMLQAVGIVDLPFDNLPDTALFSVLEAERKQAAKDGRQAYCYVDLTAKEVLPPWLVMDAVGGRSVLPGELDCGLNPSGVATTVTDLGNALRAATQGPRFFGSFQQWSACYQRYLAAVIAAKHWTVSQGLTCMGTITKLAEEQRLLTGNCCLVFLYDDLIRRRWAQRLVAGDRVDVDLVVSKKVGDVWETAKSRLQIVLAQAGLKSQSSHQGWRV